MKDIIKLIAITVTGFFIAVIFYPFLHEGGHSLAAVIVGAKVEEFNLYPLPNVLCNVQSVGTMGLVIIGISGMLFRFLITAIIQAGVLRGSSGRIAYHTGKNLPDRILCRLCGQCRGPCLENWI